MQPLPISLEIPASGLDRRSFLKRAALSSAVLGALAPLASGARLAPETGGGGGGSVPLAPPDRQPPDLKVPGPQGRKAGWAVVGLGELALEEILPAFAECERSEIVALVSGHPEKAQKVAQHYGVDPTAIYNYENYGDLAKNPKVDVIYVVLPNTMHAEYTVRGLEAGKHVYCEKPMTTGVAEAQKMIAAAEKAGRKLGIAYRLHYEPMNLKVMELCQKNAYGKVKVFTSNNCQTTKAPNIRLSNETGGGPLSDVGLYSINAARYCIGEEPVEVSAMAWQPKEDPNFRDVPESIAYTLRFPSGALANCACSFGTARSSFYEVVCEKGTIRLDPAFTYKGLRLKVTDAEGEKEFQIPEVNQFTQEIDAFSRSVLDNLPVRTPGEEGLADLRVLAALNESIKTGRTVKV